MQLGISHGSSELKPVAQPQESADRPPSVADQQRERDEARQLDTFTRVAFFRSLGRGYLRVDVAALVIAYATGALLISTGHWSAVKSAIAVTAAALVVVTWTGVVQARSLSRLRLAALAGGPRFGDDYVARRARRAGAFRGLIALLTIALVLLAAVSAS